MAGKTQVVTESTGKGIKALQAVAILIVIAGASCLLAGVPLENESLMAFGGIALFIGIPFYIVMRVVRWWAHG